jgi:hypothetical protein
MTEPNPDLQLVTVFESDDTVAFNIAKTALEDAGIEFAAFEEALTGYGFSPMVNAPCKIQVAASDQGRALELMQSLTQPPDPGALEQQTMPEESEPS